MNKEILKSTLEKLFEKKIYKLYGFELLPYEPRKTVLKILFVDEPDLHYYSKSEIEELFGWISAEEEEQLRFLFDEANNEIYSRNELIDICERSVVPYFEWNDRDSYIAQSNISDAYCLLKAGTPYSISVENQTIWLRFVLTTEYVDESSKYSLSIDSRDDYFKEFGYDNEMFDAATFYRSDTSFTAFLPTLKRLEETAGKDWY